MADIDWLLADPRQLRDIFAREVERVLTPTGIRKYDVLVPDFFVGKLQEKSSQYWREERNLAAWERRGVGYALASLAEVVDEAVGITLRENRDQLTVKDIQAAYDRKFCRIWPFC